MISILIDFGLAYLGLCVIICILSIPLYLMSIFVEVVDAKEKEWKKYIINTKFYTLYNKVISVRHYIYLGLIMSFFIIAMVMFQLDNLGLL